MRFRRRTTPKPLIALLILRECKGWSQAGLAEASGVTGAEISLFETGGRRPSDRAINKLSEALEIPSEVLFYFRDEVKDISKFSSKSKNIVELVGQILRDLDFLELILR